MASPQQTPVQRLIQQRISEVGLTMAEVSRQLGRNPAYLQQFIKLGIPKAFEEEDRKKLATILQVEEEQLKGPGKVRKYEWPRIPSSDDERALSLGMLELMKRFAEGRRIPDLDNERPVYSVVVYKDDVRIAVQARTRVHVNPHCSADAYGVRIEGDLMMPDFRNGSIAVADPKIPLRPNTMCIFRKQDIEEGGEVRIHRLRKITQETFEIISYKNFSETLCRLEQGKPSRPDLDLAPKVETLSRKDFPYAHVIVGMLMPPIT